MNEQIKKAKIALSIDEEKRFALIGYAVSTIELGVSPAEDEKSLINAGQIWLNNKIVVLKEIVCKNEKICNMHKKLTDSEELDLCFAIADMIIGACGKVPAIVVSAQIIKTGINNFCHDIWK